MEECRKHVVQIRKKIKNNFEWFTSNINVEYWEVGEDIIRKTLQELQMLSSVKINCQVTKIVINPGSQLSVS